MSHTNTTANYNLPQFVGTDKPAWLTDINQAFSNIDTAIKSAKDSADTAGGSATTANNSIGTLANLNTTEKSTLVGAINEVNTNVGIAQNTANGALNTANTTATNLNTFEKKFNLSSITTTVAPDFTGQAQSSRFTLAQNSDGSIYKLYGRMVFNSGSVIKRTTAVPGLTGYYASPTGAYLNQTPTSAYIVSCAGVWAVTDGNETNTKSVSQIDFAIGTDGQVYLFVAQQSANHTVSSGNYEIYIMHPCIYFNTDFGDTAEEE